VCQRAGRPTYFGGDHRGVGDNSLGDGLWLWWRGNGFRLTALPRVRLVHLNDEPLFKEDRSGDFAEDDLNGDRGFGEEIRLEAL
jgi:hypothetical protein